VRRVEAEPDPVPRDAPRSNSGADRGELRHVRADPEPAPGRVLEDDHRTWFARDAVALAAGVGEEFFFRGALDPLVGPWFTALGFVIVHGAIRIRDRNGLMFATFLYAASVGLSALNAWRGLEAAMAAHACYDLVMLLWLVHGAALSRRYH